MKTFALVLSLALIAVSQNALALAYKPVTDKAAVAKAIKQAVENSNLSCDAGGAKFKLNDLAAGIEGDVMDETVLILKEEAGGQPLIRIQSDDGKTIAQMEIVTDASKKAITYVSGSSANYTIQKQNIGTIDQPDFQDVKVLTDENTYECKDEKQ